MKRSRFAGIAVQLLLLGMLLVAINTAASLAQEPVPPQPEESAASSPQPHVHRRPAKWDNLGLKLADGHITDPLANGRREFDWDKIALLWQNESDWNLTAKTYDVNAKLEAPIAKDRRTVTRIDLAGNMDMAAGHLGAKPGWIQTVAAYQSAQNHIFMMLQHMDADLKIDWIEPFDTGEKVAGEYTEGIYQYGAQIRLATGDFDADGLDEVVMAWEAYGPRLYLKVYDTGAGWTLIPKGKISDEYLYGAKFLDMATGDFDGDGKDEIAIAFDGYTELTVKVYDVDGNGNLVAKAKLGNQGTWPGQISVATGDISGNGVDEIVVAFNLVNSVEGTQLKVYEVSKDLRTLTLKGSTNQPFTPVTRSSVVGVGAGDFNLDGFDEIALVYPMGPDTTYYGRCYVQVYAADVTTDTHQITKLLPRQRLLSDWLYTHGELSLSVGDMNRDAVDEIVAAQEKRTPGTTSDIAVGIFSVGPQLDYVKQEGLTRTGEHIYTSAASNGHVAMAIGGYDGNNVYVGQGKYWPLEKTLQNLATINAPPKHKDTVGGETVDVNVTDRCHPPVGPPCTYAKYENEQKTSTTMSLETHADWAVSIEVKRDFKFVSASMEASYSGSFEEESSRYKSIEFGYDVEADHDDAVIRIAQGLHVWEYPVYAPDAGHQNGHILVVFPMQVIPECVKDCEVATTAFISGKAVTSGYRPNHEFGNAMSYSNQVPTDVKTSIKSGAAFMLGANPYQMWVKWDDIKESQTKISNEMDLQESLKATIKGVTLQQKGKYGAGEVTVNKASFETSTSIHLYLDEIEQQYAYEVRPILYWAKPDGRLVLDYAVLPGATVKPQPPTWWQKEYGVDPDPAFNLPWKDGEEGPEWVLVSREIDFDPLSPTAGDQVTITAKVRNYSLVGVDNVPVRFYAGDPDKRGQVIGNETVDLSPMLSDEAVLHFDTTGYAGQTLDIFCVIDPKGTIQEVHEDNNKAYARLPVVPPGDATSPASLSISPDSITFDPELPAAGEAVQISATIRASGDTFTHVAVEFWDGDPAAGGRYIGGRMIPMILAGQSSTTSVHWDTSGLRGQRDIWVVVHQHPDEDTAMDNRARRALNLEPHRLYLPAVWKN